MAKRTRTARILDSVGGEMKRREPAIVGHTRRKFGGQRAEAQRVAILLDKARRRGANIPRKR